MQGIFDRLIKTAKMSYSFENTMYGTLGPERTVWDEEINEAMEKTISFDPFGNAYFSVGEKVGNAFKDGAELK